MLLGYEDMRLVEYWLQPFRRGGGRGGLSEGRSASLEGWCEVPEK